MKLLRNITIKTFSISAIMIAISFCYSIPAQAEQQVDYICVGPDAETEIAGYTGAEGNIPIPSKLDGANVTSISYDAFENNSNTNDLIDKTALISAITQITTYLDRVPIGSTVNHVSQEAHDNLSTSITSAISVRDNENATQEEVNQALYMVNEALTVFCKAIVTEIVLTPTSVDENSNFTQTFKASIDGFGSFPDLSPSNITLGGDFSTLAVSAVSRDSNKPWMINITITGNLQKVSGIGNVTVDTNGWTASNTLTADITVTHPLNIDAFSIPGQVGENTIDPDNRTIEITIPSTMNRNNLVAAFTLSPETIALVESKEQQSGVSANDFSNKVIYTIKGTDGSTREWTVIVTLSNANELEYFRFYSADFISGKDMDNHILTLILVPNTDPTKLIAHFKISRLATAWIGEIQQTSGITVNDFTNPLTYTIKAYDGNTQNWTVKVTIDKGKEFYSFYVPDYQIWQFAIDSNNHTIDIQVKDDTDLTNLTPQFVISNMATAKIGFIEQVSGTTANDFTSPVVYTITGTDGSTLDWTVNVHKVNKTALIAKINEANLIHGNYSSASWQAFQQALSTAMYTNNHTSVPQVYVDNVLSQLSTAMNGLIFVEVDSNQSTSSIDTELCPNTTSIITITLRNTSGDLIANSNQSLSLDLTVINNNTIRSEQYKVAGQVYSSSTVIPINATTNSQGQFTFCVELPEKIDSGDSVYIMINSPSGKTIGAVYGYPSVDECFIATAAYGSKLKPAVSLLRRFRDQYLLTNEIGAAFVKVYYRKSPPIASYIATSEPLKALVRVLLLPFVIMVYLIYHPILGITAVGLCIFLLMRNRRKAVI